MLRSSLDHRRNEVHYQGRVSRNCAKNQEDENIIAQASPDSSRQKGLRVAKEASFSVG